MVSVVWHTFALTLFMLGSSALCVPAWFMKHMAVKWWFAASGVNVLQFCKACLEFLLLRSKVSCSWPYCIILVSEMKTVLARQAMSDVGIFHHAALCHRKHSIQCLFPSFPSHGSAKRLLNNPICWQKYTNVTAILRLLHDHYDIRSTDAQWALPFQDGSYHCHCSVMAKKFLW